MIGTVPAAVAPPFRADHVGSFLRPQVLLDARERYRAGCITAADLRHVEDDAIQGVVKFQEDLGLRGITDGEFRRTYDLPRRYARLINAAIAGRPATMRVCVHLCRGNFKSAWAAEGGYEPVAEVLFNELAVDGYFLEYDVRGRAISRRCATCPQANASSWGWSARSSIARKRGTI
jgi:methionine synthase II (cobalamin-independent)